MEQGVPADNEDLLTLNNVHQQPPREVPMAISPIGITCAHRLPCARLGHNIPQAVPLTLARQGTFTIDSVGNMNM